MADPTPKDIDLAHAALFGEGTWEQRIAQLIADQREADALVCDDVATGESRTAPERAVARHLAKLIRSRTQ